MNVMFACLGEGAGRSRSRDSRQGSRFSGINFLPQARLGYQNARLGVKSVLKLLYALYMCDNLPRRRALRQDSYSNIQVLVLMRNPKTSRASPDALGYTGSTE